MAQHLLRLTKRYLSPLLEGSGFQEHSRRKWKTALAVHSELAVALGLAATAGPTTQNAHFLAPYQHKKNCSKNSHTCMPMRNRKERKSTYTYTHVLSNGCVSVRNLGNLEREGLPTVRIPLRSRDLHKREENKLQLCDFAIRHLNQIN